MAMTFTNTPCTRRENISITGSCDEQEEEKTIPFLRRLRDMLIENQQVISFSPGRLHNKKGSIALGRIIVHDRIKVENGVLQRYFNHSSFASFRRQLNYFSFVRLGKGRQRESAYVNENVVELDDILHLKRRPAGTNFPTIPASDDIINNSRRGATDTTRRPTSVAIVDSSQSTLNLNKIITPSQENRTSISRKQKALSPPSSSFAERVSKKQCRNRRHNTPKMANILSSTTCATANGIPLSAFPLSPNKNLISEDEQSQDKPLPCSTLRESFADDDLLAGCNALLDLAWRRRGWE